MENMVRKGYDTQNWEAEEEQGRYWSHCTSEILYCLPSEHLSVTETEWMTFHKQFGVACYRNTCYTVPWDSEEK